MRLFGRFELLSPDGETATPRGRKSRALLAYVQLAEAPVPRERLASLLWGDRGVEQARASLRQTLYELRHLTVEPRPLLRLGRTNVEALAESDLAAMRALRDSADAQALAGLLTEVPGEFLADLDDVDADFDSWLAGQRVRRGEERHAIGLAVAARALAAGDGEGAWSVASRLLAAEPFDEAATRLAMQARALCGDRNGVRQVFARYAQALRRELDIAPSAELAELERRLSTADPPPPPPSASPSAAAPLPAATEPVSPRPPEAARPLRRAGRPAAAAWVAAAAALMLLTGGAWLWNPGRDRPWVLLVEPLKAPPTDAAAQALGVGLSAELARMVVGADQRLVVREPKDQPPFAWLWADFLITGEIRTDAGVLHANVRLLNGRTRAILWSNSFSRPAAEADAMRGQIASRIADVAECAEGGRKPLPRSLDDETLRLYLEGCEQKHGDWNLSAKLLGEAVQRRPDFAHAWAMYSAATNATASFVSDEAGAPILRRSEAYARRALALDPTEGEAYDTLAGAVTGIERWPEQMAILMAGHRVDPNNAIVNTDISWDFASVGRWREATEFAELAGQYDPFSTVMAARRMRLLGFGGRPDSAMIIADQLASQWPHDPLIADARFVILSQAGDPTLALAMIDDPQRAFEATPQEDSVWRKVEAARLQRTPAAIEAAAKAARAEAAAPSESTQVFVAIEQLVVIGRVDDAYAVADRIPDGAFTPTWSFFYDYMAPFRADRRFMDLAARQGLTQVWRRTGVWPDFCQDQKLPYDCRRAAAASEAKLALRAPRTQIARAN